MKRKWKKLLWSSLGSMALGVAVALVRKPRPRRRPLRCRRIPAQATGVTVWTSRFVPEGDAAAAPVQDRYLLQATPFKVWSVLELSPGADRGESGGAPVYHVTHVRIARPGESAGGQEAVIGRFYGTVGTLRPERDGCVRNYLARGGFLEMAKCQVGGASNGVETGEVHHSAAPVLNYRFEGAAGEALN